MAFSVTIKLTTAGADTGPTFNLYSNVDSYATAFETGVSKTNLTSTNGYTSILVPDNTTTIKVKSVNGSCPTAEVLLPISGIVTPTATPTATPTSTAGVTTTPTSTSTPTTTTTSTPTTTSTSTPTITPTLTVSTVTYGCGDTVSDTYAPSNFTTQTKYLDLSEATNGDTITISYTANDRPNRFNIYGNGSFVTSSLWSGSDPDMGTTYTGPWTGNPIDSDGSGSFTFTYVAGTSYELRVDVGAANPNASPVPNPSDAWSVTIGCASAIITPTITPTLTLNRFYVAAPVSDITTTYCVSPGYVLTGALWSYATTISGLMNEQVYIDEYGDDIFIGVDGYKYAVSLTAGINTYTDGSSNYELIQIDQYGSVWNVLSPNCSGSGGGGDIPL